MPGIGEPTGGKSPEQLAMEAVWFITHTLIALFIYAAMVTIVQLVHPKNPSMLLATIAVFFVPAMAGFIIALIKPNEIARYIWIFGVLWFSIVCVWVLDLPTGPGLCEHCGALEKLWDTLITFNKPSGLLDYNGNVFGTWPALATIGYAFGAKYGLKRNE